MTNALLRRYPSCLLWPYKPHQLYWLDSANVSRPQVLSTTAYQYTGSTQSCFSPVSHNIGIVGGIGKRSPACQCMGRREAEVWQCRSVLARGLIVRRCLTHFAGGFKAWAYVLMISLACMLGLWSASPTMHRYLLAFYLAHSTAWLSL